MARINSYVTDVNVQALDKWVGTDFAGGITKNFTAENVAIFLNKANAVGIAGQSNFFFQTDILQERFNGSISFDAGSGDGTALSSITSLKFSKYSSNNKVIIDYLQNLVGGQILLCQVDDINAFAVYTLNSLTQDPIETDFYDASLTSTASNGNIIDGKYYGVSSYATGSGGGGGNTVTSYRSDAVGTTIYAGYLLNGNPVITRYIEGVLATAQGVTDLETDWANRLNLTYV